MDLNRHLDGFQSFFSPDIQHGSSKYSKIFRVPRRWSSIPPIPHGTSKSYPPYTHMEVSQNGVPENGWFIRENPTKMDDLGVPLFEETTTSSQIAGGVDPIHFWVSKMLRWLRLPVPQPAPAPSRCGTGLVASSPAKLVESSPSKMGDKHVEFTNQVWWLNRDIPKKE